MPYLIRIFLLLSLVALAGCSVVPTAEKPIDGLILLTPVKGANTQVLKQKVTLKKYTQAKTISCRHTLFGTRNKACCSITYRANFSLLSS